MFAKAIKKAKSAMFPIFRWEQVSPQQINIVVTGVGFFVNTKGYFVSVAHIFDNASNNTKFFYFGLLPDKLQNPRLEIKEVVRDNDHDIFIGRVKVKNSRYLYLAKHIPDIGRSVCISGYPLAQIQSNNQGGLELSGVRRYFQPSFVLDKAVVNSGGGAGLTRRHDGFLVRDPSLFGMSGGPVFGAHGLVFGMQGSVTQPRISTNASGRSISVENAVVIRSNLILDLLKKNRIRSNFFGRF
jgi:S1-C subfamily serine protease